MNGKFRLEHKWITPPLKEKQMTPFSLYETIWYRFDEKGWRKIPLEHKWSMPPLRQKQTTPILRTIPPGSLTLSTWRITAKQPACDDNRYHNWPNIYITQAEAWWKASIWKSHRKVVIKQCSYHNNIIDIQNRLPYSKVVYPAIIVLFSCLMEVNHGVRTGPN